MTSAYSRHGDANLVHTLQILRATLMSRTRRKAPPRSTMRHGAARHAPGVRDLSTFALRGSITTREFHA